MHDTRTILCGHVTSGNHTEGPICQRLDHRHQLLVGHPLKVGSLVMTDDGPGDDFVTFIIFAEVGIASFLIEISRQACLCQHHGHRFGGVRIVCPHCHIVNLWSYTKSGVGSQSPWCGGPGEEIGFAPLCHLRFG